MKAMIFAAGFGKRLHPLTLKTPKALVKVKGRPILDWVVEHLIQHGVDDLMINTHYLHSEIQTYIQARSFPIPVSISHEETILGTGCGLFKTREFWNSSDFFVHNVDILCNADLGALHSFHKLNNAIVTLATNQVKSGSMLLVDEVGLLVGRSLNSQWLLYKKPQGNVSEAGFCGFQVISASLFDQVLPPMSFSIIDDYMNLIKAGRDVFTWPIGESYWVDIGTPEALQKANVHFPE